MKEKLRCVVIVLLAGIVFMACGDDDTQKEQPETGISESGDTVNAETQHDPAGQLAYDVKSIQDSVEAYAYYENPYYLEGIEKYIEPFNAIYSEFETGQMVKIQTLDSVLEEAGVSKSFREEILSAEGRDIFEEQDIRRIEEKEDERLFFSKGSFFEVAEKAKEDIEGEIFTTLYYMGDLKDNRPDGEGAIFAITTSGVRLLHAGDFKEGRQNGKGVSFTTTPLGAVLQGYASYENDEKDGKCTDYGYEDVASVYNLYKEYWVEYHDSYYQSYTDDEKTKALSHFLTDFAMELVYITTCYEENGGYFDVHVNYPVIVPVISYQGEYKEDEYSGKGMRYGTLGMPWYEGEFKNGSYNGKGTLYYATGTVQYEGEFKDGYMNGRGTLYNVDETVRKEGDFHNTGEDSDSWTAQNASVYSRIEEKLSESGGDMRMLFEGIRNPSVEEQLTGFDENYDTWADEEQDYTISDDTVQDHDIITDEEGFIFPYSSQSEIMMEDLQNLTSEELRIARNEIYARHGRIFGDSSLQSYFEQFEWYEGLYDADEFDDSVLNEYEKANLDMIAAYESDNR